MPIPVLLSLVLMQAAASAPSAPSASPAAPSAQTSSAPTTVAQGGPGQGGASQMDAPQSAPAAAEASDASPPDPTVCRSVDVAGSAFPKRVCHTLSYWIHLSRSGN